MHHHNSQNIVLATVSFFGRLAYGVYNIAKGTAEYLPELKDVTKEACMALLFFSVTYLCGVVVEMVKKRWAKKDSK